MARNLDYAAQNYPATKECEINNSTDHLRWASLFAARHPSSAAAYKLQLLLLRRRLQNSEGNYSNIFSINWTEYSTLTYNNKTCFSTVNSTPLLFLCGITWQSDCWNHQKIMTATQLKFYASATLLTDYIHVHFSMSSIVRRKFNKDHQTQFALYMTSVLYQ